MLDRTFLSVFSIALLGLGAGAMLLPVLPRFAEGELGAGPVGVGLAVGANSITALLFQPLAGRIGDLRGRRVLLVGGTALGAVSFVAYAFADSLALVVAARLVTGIGEALWFVGAATVVNDLAPPARRGEAFSYFTVAMYGGLAIGPLAGDLLLGGDRYGLVFMVAAVTTAAACAVALRVPETRPDHGEAPHGHLVYRGAILPGLVLLTGLLAFGGFNAFIALYAIEIGIERTGLVFATFAVTVVAVRLFGARLPDRLGARRAGFVALAGIATGMAIIAASPSAAALFAGTVVLAFGQGLSFPAMMALTIAGAPASARSAAVGTLSAFVDVSLVAGAVVLGFVADLSSYRGAFAFAAIVAASGIALLTRLSEAPATLDERFDNPVEPVR
jgi:MFS family permease